MRRFLAPRNRREYEFYVAERLSNEGFERIKVTKASKDGGYDILAYKEGKKWLVSVKKYAKNVGVKEVREILGVAFEKKGFAMLVTTHGFSKEAYNFAQSAKVVLRVMST